MGRPREIAAGCAWHPPADCGCGCHYGFGPRDQWTPAGERGEVKARGSELSPRGQQVTSRNLGSDSPAPCGEGPGSHPLASKGLTCPPRSPDLSDCAAEQGPDTGQEAGGSVLIFSQSWMTHSSAAASGTQGGHSGHRLGGQLGPFPVRTMPAPSVTFLHPLGGPGATKSMPIAQMGPQRLREAEWSVQGYSMRWKQEMSEANSFSPHSPYHTPESSLERGRSRGGLYPAVQAIEAGTRMSQEPYERNVLGDKS